MLLLLKARHAKLFITDPYAAHFAFLAVWHARQPPDRGLETSPKSILQVMNAAAIMPNTGKETFGIFVPFAISSRAACSFSTAN